MWGWSNFRKAGDFVIPNNVGLFLSLSNVFQNLVQHNVSRYRQCLLTVGKGLVVQCVTCIATDLNWFPV